MAQESHKHHYVPEWYQRRFLAPDATDFLVLDLDPPKYRRPDGSVAHARAIRRKGPSRIFFEKDLYTTRFFGTPNDAIERLLFGAIDRIGRRAIDAYLAEDWRVVHHTYMHVYEFMDALRLRTPKGLLFVRKVSGAATQQQLMFWLQQVRRMHCVMWAEGVLEIVSAEDSPTKFLLSDHPVTLFNSAVFPKDPSMPANMDPLPDWMGTQTLFPFDQKRLFVLSHLEWVQSRGSVKARERRTNARYFDSPLLRYDHCIRGRKLTEEQVREVNYIIKARAHRFVAARKEDELFPERFLKTRMWNKLGTFLLPDRHKLFGFGGQMFVGFKDGSVYWQDEFGRRPKTKEEYERRATEARAMEAQVKRALEKHLAEKRQKEKSDG